MWEYSQRFIWMAKQWKTCHALMLMGKCICTAVAWKWSIVLKCLLRKSNIREMQYCCLLLYLILVHESILKIIFFFMYYSSKVYDNYWEPLCSVMGHIYSFCTSKVMSTVQYPKGLSTAFEYWWCMVQSEKSMLKDITNYFLFMSFFFRLIIFWWIN